MRRPPIIPSRPDQELFNRVNKRFNELSAITVSAEKRVNLNRQLEVEFIDTSLKLEGADISDESLVASSLEAFRMVREAVESEGKQAELTFDLLSRLGAAAGGGLRKGPGSRGTNTVAAEHLPLILEGACRWFGADSFAELNPAEQAAIAALRLIELQPFEEANQRLALIASSLFTMRSGLPPIIIRQEEFDRYQAAIDEGLQANTKPLVELIAVSLESSLTRMIRDQGSGVRDR